MIAACAVCGGETPAGFPSRAVDLDVLPGFGTPAPGYGEVAFYWWLGDPLTKDRLTWHLDQLAGKGVSALQVNYAHSTLVPGNTIYTGTLGATGMLKSGGVFEIELEGVGIL